MALSGGHKDLLLELSELLFERDEAREAIRVFGRINSDLYALGADDAFKERYESLKTRLSRPDP